METLIIDICGSNLSGQFNAIAPELEQASMFYGTHSRVARRLGATPQHVQQVARGQRTFTP